MAQAETSPAGTRSLAWGGGGIDAIPGFSPGYLEATAVIFLLSARTKLNK